MSVRRQCQSTTGVQAGAPVWCATMRWHTLWLTRSHSCKRSACTRGTAMVDELGATGAADVKCWCINGRTSVGDWLAMAGVVGSARMYPEKDSAPAVAVVSAADAAEAVTTLRASSPAPPAPAARRNDDLNDEDVAAAAETAAVVAKTV